jgi:S1-C subfamily serine protease
MLVVLLAGCAGLPPTSNLSAPLRAVSAIASTAQTVQVFTEITAQNRGGRSTLGFSRESVQISRIYAKGTAWAVVLEGHQYLVTAAHVVGVGEHPEPVVFQEVKNGEVVTRTKLAWDNSPRTETAYQVRVGVGDFGTSVKNVGLFSPDSPLKDVALLEPTEDRVFAELRSTPLAGKVPQVGDTVRALGIPDTFAQQLTSATVAAVFERQGYFVLSTALPPGYSGGVVLDKEGRAVGVVTSTSKNQTTVILVNGARLKGAEFKPARQVFSKNPEAFQDLK